MDTDTPSSEISLATPTQAPTDQISIGSPLTQTVTLPTAVVDLRASKTTQAVGDRLGMSEDDIRAHIQEGREDQIRQQAASNINADRAKQKIDTLKTLALQKGGPLDEDEVARVMDPFNPNNKQVDPETVTEVEYAKKYVTTVRDAAELNKSVVDLIAKQQPQIMDEAEAKGKDLVGRIEYARKLRETWEGNVANQGWGGWTADTIKNAFQPYVEAKTRDSLFDMSHGILLGNYMQDKAEEIARIPDFDEYAKAAKDWVESVGKDNPQLAARMASYLEGLPSSDRFLDNAFTALTPFDYAAIAKGGLNVVKGAHMATTANTAVRQIVEKAGTAGADTAAKAEAVGDLATAATTRVENNVVKDLAGSRDPISLATEPLLTYMNQDKEKLAANAGNLSTEGVRRLQSQYDASGKSFIQRLTDAVRINRIPAPLAVKEGIARLKDAAVEWFPGIRNAVLDVSDPMYEPKSNTFWHEITFGNYDATIFSNPETAANFAKQNGFQDVKIVRGEGPLTNAKIQDLLDRKVALDKDITNTEHAVEANRLRMNDEKLSEADRAKAKEQHTGLSKAKDQIQKELDEVKLRLEGNETYDRVASLQTEVDAHRAELKTLKGNLRKITPSDEAGQVFKGEVVGKYPAKGVAPASIGADGKLYIGEPNTMHFSLSQTHGDNIRANAKLKPGQGLWKDDGFVNPEGKYLTREEAYSWVSANEKKIKPSEGMEGRLDALDYREKVPEAKKSTGKGNAGNIHNRVNELTEAVANKTQEIRALKSGKAEPIKRSDTIVQQHGVGYKIVIRRPLVETDKAARDLMIRDVNGNLVPEAISTSSQKGLKSLINGALWKLRSAEDTLSLNENIQRKVGTYTQSLFREWAFEEAKYIRQLSSGVIRSDPVTGQPIPYWKAKPQAVINRLTPVTEYGKTASENKFISKSQDRYNAFIRTLEHARDAKDPNTGLPGYFFETPGELNNHYLQYFGRTADFAEHQAYQAYRRIIEGDRILREVSEFRNRARLGVEQFSIGNRAAGGKSEAVSSDWFDGRRLKKFPGGDDVLLVMGKRLGQNQERVVNLGGQGLSHARIEEYRKAVEDGRMVVVEVYAPEHRPLRDFVPGAGEEHIRYILTDNVKSKPIEFNHVNRRGGGHFENDYDQFLKQAKMYHQYENVNGVKGAFKSVYTGDSTFMPILNKEMGRDMAEKLHKVQALIKFGKEDEAKDFIRQTMPIEPHTLLDMFKPGRDASGRQVAARLSLEEPFVVVPKNKSVYDMDAQRMVTKYGNAWKDGTRSGSLNKQFQVAYNTERESEGLVHWEDVGTAGNPVYKYAPSGKMVDPITTMSKALNRIVNTTFMDDYKIYAVEHWLREAEPYLEPIRLKLARSSPNWVFASSLDKSAFIAGAPPEVVRNLLSNRFKINQFTGMPSSVDTAIHAAKEWLVNTSYRAFGPEENRNILQKAIVLPADWTLSHIKDPVAAMKGFTFHAKLGLFNPAQLLVQAQTYALILAVSPLHGSSGTMGALLHQWSRVNRNPAFLDTLDRYASRFSIPGQAKWKPGEFREAMETLERTGFENVAGEYSNLDTALKTDFIGNNFKNFLNAGTVFFTEGEKSTRLGAWYTAFKEYRAKVPTGALSNDDIGKILQRADLLTANMSRASHSYINSGIFGASTQFLTYQVRLAELFMGTRLGATTFDRNMARLRLMTFYSLLYGAPSAIGLSGLPLQNSIRTEAYQRGYTPGENWLSTAVDQGLPAMLLAHLTGKDFDWKKGNLYNIGSRLGSPGFTQLVDAFKSDHAWWQLLAGASGTVLLDTLTSTNNFFHAMAEPLRPNGERQFPLKLDDLLDVAKQISSVNQGWKLHMAINTGKWMSKNEGYIGDTTAGNAAFMAVFGLSPNDQDYNFIKSNIRKADEDYQKGVVREAIKERQRGFEDQKLGNTKSGIDHFRRSDALMELGGLSNERKADVISMSVKGYESMIDQNDYAYATKKVRQSRSDFLGIPMPFNTQSNIPQTRLEQYRTQIQLNKGKQF